MAKLATLSKQDFDDFFKFFGIKTSTNVFQELKNFSEKVVQDDNFIEESLITGIYDNYDADENGTMDKQELRNALADFEMAFGIVVPEGVIEDGLQTLNITDANNISKELFLQLIDQFDIDSLPKRTGTSTHIAQYSKRTKQNFEPILRILGVEPTGNLFLDLNAITQSGANTVNNILENCFAYAFKVYDANGDGHISIDELKAIINDVNELKGEQKLSGDALIEKTNTLLQKIDTDKNGTVEFGEFKDALSSHAFF